MITYGIVADPIRPLFAKANGGEGNDTIRFELPCIFQVSGDEGDDTIHGSPFDDKIYGGIGDDLIFGKAGDDLLVGDMGDDVLHGNEGNDVLWGNAGFDNLWGWQGDDHIIPSDFVEEDGFGIGNDGADRFYVKHDGFFYAYYVDDHDSREGDHFYYQYAPPLQLNFDALPLGIDVTQSAIQAR